MLHDKLSFGALAAVSCLGLFVIAGPTSAADLDPALVDAPQVLPQSNVVFGSGWYVRGDIGATEMPKINVTSLTGSLAPTTTISDHKLGYTASLGGGYEINQWFRTDVVADFNQSLHASSAGPIVCPPSTCGGYNAKINSYDALVNGYVDLGNWHRVTPYVGAGVGLSFGDVRGTSFLNGTSYSGSSNLYYNVAFGLMAGFSVDIFDHTKLDIGYRYLHLGQVLGSNIDMQEVRAGLRYMIDN